MGLVVAAVGTTHPWNIAGIGLDLARNRERGIRTAIVVAGISAQDARGVHLVAPVEPAVVTAQFAALADLGLGAIRIGLLPSVAIVHAVAAALAAFPGVPVVCDPVRGASVGGTLLIDDTRGALRDALFPRCTLVTPNLDEAAWLAGFPVTDRAGMERAGAALRACGATAVLVKGGHLADAAPTDVRIDATGMRAFIGDRLPATIRGTGDLLAAGIARALARGAALDDAIATARADVRAAIVAGVMLGGMRVAD